MLADYALAAVMTATSHDAGSENMQLSKVIQQLCQTLHAAAAAAVGAAGGAVRPPHHCR
jgi:hypothetical protein